MPSPTAVAHVLYGEDAPTLKDRLEAFLAEHTDPADVGLNLTRLDAAATAADIEAAAGALPFMADLRVVLVENLTASAGGRTVIDALPEMLPRLPDWARVVFAETHLKSDSRQAAARSKALKKLINAVEGDPRGRVQAFALPQERERPRWIMERARSRGGEIEPQAAALLAHRIGEDLTLADMELAKLSTYAAGRAISAEDVERLTPYSPEASIFEMVDALGQRQGEKALTLVRQLLDDGDDPLRIYGMIIRQYRLLLMVREQLDRGQTPATMEKTIGVKGWLARKLAGQAGYYSLDLLERIYRKLLEIDLDMKTGQMDPVLALETLITTLAGRG